MRRLFSHRILAALVLAGLLAAAAVSLAGASDYSCIPVSRCIDR